MVGSNCQLQNSRPIFLGSSRTCHSPSGLLSLAQGRPYSCYATLDTSDTLASEMKLDWSNLQHKYTERKHWHRFYPQKNNLKASSTWTDGEFWQTSWAHSVVLWTRPLDQSAMEGWPWKHSVNNTGCCYWKPPAVKIWHRGGEFYRLSLVIKQATHAFELAR